MEDIQSNLFSRLCLSAEQWPDKTALSSEGRQYPYRDLLVSALKIAGRVKAHRNAGERIGLLAPNGMAFASTFYGILAADRAVVPFNILLAPQELAAQARHADIDLLLTAGGMEPLAQAALSLDRGRYDILTIESILQMDSPAPLLTASLTRKDRDLAVLLYTSGTTGDPKGVMLSHRNLLANCLCYMDTFQFTEADTFVCVLPFFHSFALTTVLLGALLGGAEVRIVPKFHPKVVLQELYKARMGVFLGVPSFFSVLARSVPEDTPPLSNLRLVVSGGAALLSHTQKDFEERFKTKVLQGYGLTEASPVVASNAPHNNIDGTVGPALPGVEVQIWDDQDHVLPPGHVGELLVRGENVMSGYFRDPDTTASTIVNGWLRTGDFASLDERGYIRIAGRKKEIIISAGHNIFPAEVENVLLTHPHVAETAVIGVPDNLKGEVPKAFIVMKDSAVVTGTAFRRYCLERLAAYKVPAYYEFLDAIPKTPAGKIARNQLVQTNAQTVKTT